MIFDAFLMHIWPNVCFNLFFEKRKEREKEMEMEHNYASKGVAGAGLTTGIIGTSLGVLNSGLLNGTGLFGGWGNRGYGYGGGYGGYGMCDSMMPVTRYEADLQAKIADRDSHIGLLEADKYTDNKILEVYGYVDGRLRNLEAQICNQAVVNAQVTANISCMQNNLATLNGLTKTVIPIGNVCPAPMPEFNSWTAPTTA